MVWGCVRCAPISLSLSFSAVLYSKAYCFARVRFVNRSLSHTSDTAEGKEWPQINFLEVLLDEFSNLFFTKKNIILIIQILIIRVIVGDRYLILRKEAFIYVYNFSILNIYLFKYYINLSGIYLVF
ncbi:hypothetical protein MUK42_31418 [Musa troglodytarum]|uniref:Uncharacterized protein n=1 Tax=Musa troglodytarum TaxID=320322 RepID=A0A9E7JYN2_9LILI|nr:hypothetical protein MUK42_31418 [Musa troglodytarum]